METIIYEQKFEWDRNKAKLNKIKHGISFKTATAIFDDPNRIEDYDEAHSFDEDRWKVIGMADEVLFVIYTERRERLRIISAREANETERRRYYGQLGDLCTESGNAFDIGTES